MSELIETMDVNEEESEESSPINMQVTIEKTSDVERKLAIEIPWEDVKTRLDKAYHELQRGLTIKGFRRGKVPRKIMEQLLGKHVTKEVAQRMVQDSVSKAIKENNINPVSEPTIVDDGIHEGQSFRYSAVIQIVPEIEPKDYFGVDAKVRPEKVTDEDLNTALLQKQREMTAYKAIEGRATQEGDCLLVDIMGKVGSEVIDKQQELIELSMPPVEPFPGLAAKLTGIAADQKELELELDIPLHAHDQKEPNVEGTATKHARLLVTIHDIKQKVVPEIDDEFARDTGEAETLDGLREVLRNKLVEQDKKLALEEAKQGLLKEITKRNNIPLVPALVERQLDQSIKYQLALFGLEPNSHRIDEDALKEHMREGASDNVKEGLLLEAIAKVEKVELSDADVELALANIAQERSQNIAKVRSEYAKQGRMAALRGHLLEKKTLDLLMSKANIIYEKSAETEPQTTPAPKEE